MKELNVHHFIEADSLPAVLCQQNCALLGQTEDIRGLGEAVGWRAGLAVSVKTPAGDFAVRFDAAAVRRSGADGEESSVSVDALRAASRVGPVVAGAAPAGDGAVRFDAAAVAAVALMGVLKGRLQR